jgi:hypothetical protein
MDMRKVIEDQIKMLEEAQAKAIKEKCDNPSNELPLYDAYYSIKHMIDYYYNEGFEYLKIVNRNNESISKENITTKELLKIVYDVYTISRSFRISLPKSYSTQILTVAFKELIREGYIDIDKYNYDIRFEIEGTITDDGMKYMVG